jgi:DNA-binding transcriptional LysR family regulator
MRNINLRQLEAFRAVMMTKSITRAAETMFVSQPAVSRLIADFETAIGFPLFERVKRRLLPTLEAHALYEEVDRSFAGLNKINLAAREIREFRSGGLTVAALPSLGLGYLPEQISKFATDRPDVSLSLIIRSSQNVSSLVAAQRADIGFTESIDFGDDVDAEVLLTTNLVCILPDGHRLAQKQQIEARDLDGETYVGTGNRQLTLDDLDRFFDQQKVKLKIQVDTQLHATVAEFVLYGTGVGIIDPITAERYAHKGLQIRPFIPSMPYKYYVIFPEGRPRSRLAVQFLREVRDHISRFALTNVHSI